MKFILILKNTDPPKDLSPAAMQAMLENYMGWSAKLRNEGRLVDSDGLSRTGRILSGEGGVITDGPFVETKEMIGGYYIFTADSLDEAAEISRGCPALGYGGTTELRPIMDYD